MIAMSKFQATGGEFVEHDRVRNSCPAVAHGKIARKFRSVTGAARERCVRPPVWSRIMCPTINRWW